MHFAFWINTICNLDKYNLQFGQIQFAIWINTICNLDKYSLDCLKLVITNHFRGFQYNMLTDLTSDPQI